MRSFAFLLVIWAFTCAASAHFANVLSVGFVAAIMLLAIAQWLVGVVPRLLFSASQQDGSSKSGGVLYIESTVVLSMAVVLSALMSPWVGAAAYALYFALCLVARRWPVVATQPPAVFEPADPYLLAVAAVGAVAGLYLALPALNAAALGYEAYDAAIWIDAPFHASYVAAFAHALTTGHYNDVHGAGLPTQFYHWAGYAMPSLLKAMSGAAALPLVQICTVWVGIPLAIALYELGKRFTSCDKVAALAALLVLVVPDFGLSSLGHSVFGFHWLLNVAFANAIGTAIALTAFAVMVDACRGKSVRQLLGAWLLGASVLLFKGQIFVLMSVPLSLYPSAMWSRLSPLWRIGSFLVGATVVGVVTWAASFSNALPLIRLDLSGASRLLTTLAATAPQWIADGVQSLAGVPAIPSAFTLLLVLAVVLFLPWFALLVGANIFGRVERQATAKWSKLLLLLSGTYLVAAIALAPDDRMATGGPFEIQLQGQIWGYACFALACSIYVGEALLRGWGAKLFCPVVVLVCLSLIMLVPPTRAVQRTATIALPPLRVGPTNSEIRQVRLRAPRCGLLLVADGDPLMLWQAAFQRPSWVVDYAMNPKQRPEVTIRWRAASASGDIAVEWLSERGISIYVEPKPGGTTVAPFKLGRQPDDESASYRVWFISPTDAACATNSTNG